MALEKFTVSPIDYKTAMAVIIEKHYLHRQCPCSFAFGLFEDGNLMGVVIYGTPSSAPLRSGIAGLNNKDNVLELTRLWVDDAVPKNGESFLIGATLKLVDKEIIVSYAQIDQGHLGVVYQATNWLYTGLSAKRTNWTISGIDKHCQTLADKHTAKEIRELYGDRLSLQPRPRKHRYIYLNCNKYRRKTLLSELKYPLMPYPKAENILPAVFLKA
jgi:hypothetical protein